MNAPVDVLEVMDRLIGNARTMAGLSGDPTLRRNIKDGEQARAAMAELIIEADDAAKLLSNLIAAGQVDARYGDHVADLIAGIAYVGGAA